MWKACMEIGRRILDGKQSHKEGETLHAMKIQIASLLWTQKSSWYEWHVKCDRRARKGSVCVFLSIS